MRLLQTKLGENPYQCHNGHDPADDIHDEVGFILRGLQRHVHFRRRLARHHPRRGVVVLTGGLVQPGAPERAAEPEATGAAAVQVAAGHAHERRVPLAHHVVVAAALVLDMRALRHRGLGLVKRGHDHEVVGLPRLALRVAHHNFHQKVAEQQLSAPHRGSLFTPLALIRPAASSEETSHSHA